MARGVEVGDYWREAIILNISVYKEAITRGTAFIRGLFCFGVMVAYDNLLTFELARGLYSGAPNVNFRKISVRKTI